MVNNKLKRVHKPLKQVMKKPYTQETVTLNRNTIKKFVRPVWHREWRVGHVNTIRNSVMRGVHFSENITVNCVGGKYRVLNGNHRVEAVIQILQRDPSFKIEVTLTKYRDLDVEEELAIYDIVNRTKKETSIDKVKAHCIESDFVKRALKSFPCKILFRGRGATDRDALPITVVVAPYVHRNEARFAGGNTMKLIEEINKLDEDDYDNIVKFHLFFKEVFGSFDRDNLYTNYNFITVVAKVYYGNVGIGLTRAEAVSRLKQMIKRYTSHIQMFSNGGVTMQKDLYLFVLDKIAKRKKLFNVFDVKKEVE